MNEVGNEAAPVEVEVDVEVVREAGAVVVVVSGEVDLSTGSELLDALISEVDRHQGGGPLIVDLDGVRFLSSAGLSALAQADRAAREREVDLRVVSSSRVTLRPLQITGLTGRLAVFADRADAMAYGSADAPSRRIS
ncbi:STAS domain-containing protein [Pseudonocardia sp. MH-G8]|uniref:STAS domain-containing protein n=1 Tax=Pseudonocardia sp. MH-G8 TaxID=1854588 RepID=UPI000BA0A2BE|nr:STAS domain-containing protein [Pseudonocardia sp. MH-G8]OZM78291.1 hypothetical protein CFP66_31935 [Pseudonocardia sp. MH-G8]